MGSLHRISRSLIRTFQPRTGIGRKSCQLERGVSRERAGRVVFSGYRSATHHFVPCS